MICQPNTSGDVSGPKGRRLIQAFILGILASTVSACATDKPPDDGGNSSENGGGPSQDGRDGGGPPQAIGMGSEAVGMSSMDGGSSSRDGGSGSMDGGSGSMDGGSSATDGGNSSMDGGSSSTDGGNGSMDGGNSSDPGIVPPDGGAASPDSRAGCQDGRFTTLHGEGTMSGEGNYMPCLMDLRMSSGELSLNIAADGSVLRAVVMEPLGIAVSADHGETWERRLLPKDAPTFVEDSYLDPVTGRLFYTAAASSSVLFSDDLGKTWSTGTVKFNASEPDASSGDWPKMFAGAPTKPRQNGYPRNTYLCNWTVPLGITSPFRCYRSTDGGQTFAPVGPEFASGECSASDVTPGMAVGRGVVDSRDGTIYLPVEHCNDSYLYVSRDDGETWTVKPIPDSGSNGSLTLLLNGLGPEVTAGQVTDHLALDSAGNVYVMWVAKGMVPTLTHSKDGGESWSAPIRVTPPDVLNATLPSMTVRPDGRVGVSYYGTADGKTWTGYLTISADVTVKAPVFETASVTRPGEPLMDQACCYADGLLEYTSAKWAQDGSLWAAFAKYQKSGTLGAVVGRLVPR
jgi:hypothetical protein